MTDRENRMEDENRPHYWASEVPKLIGPGTPSLSTFYRYARQGKIRKVDVQGPEDAYDGPDVRRFLRGELSRKKAGQARRKPPSKAPRVAVAPSMPEPIIDCVRERSDLAYVFLFLMEGLERGEDTLLPKVALSWIEENGWAYWFLSNPRSKEDIWASLGLLPLREELIFRLLRGEVGLQNITAADILPYEPSETPYSCYLFVTAGLEHKDSHVDSLAQIFQKVLAYLCEKSSSLRIGKIYLSVPYGTELTPSRLLVKEYYFSPLHQVSQSAWMLDLEFANPSVYVQKLQECVEKSKKKEENSMSPVITPEKQLEIIERRRERRVRTEPSGISGYGRYRPALNGRMSVLQITKDKVYRTISSDDDIRAVLDINASWFGKSTRPEEDLIRTRRAWIEKNPEVFHVLEVSSRYLLEAGIYSPEELRGVSKKIVGFISMLPLSEDAVAKLVRGELVVSQVQGEDIIPYQPGVPVDLFVQTLAVHNEINKRSEMYFTKFGSDLNKGLMGMFSSYGEQGIEIRHIYARSDTPFGKNAATGFAFEKVPPPPGVTKDVFFLDVMHSTFRFLQDYAADVQRYKAARGIIAS